MNKSLKQTASSSLIVAMFAVVLLTIGLITSAPADVTLLSDGRPDIGATGLTAQITPETTGECRDQNVYMGVWTGYAWFLRDANNFWSQYTGGPYPRAGQVDLTGCIPANVTVVNSNVNILEYRGFKVSVGYGQIDADVLSRPGHIAEIYTVPTGYSVYAAWIAGRPYAVDRVMGLTMIVNKTRFPGRAPFMNCWMMHPSFLTQTDGKILTNCQHVTTYDRHILYIDRTTNELYDYTGIVPAGIVWISRANNSDKPEWSAKARVLEGWFFNPYDHTKFLEFQFDTGEVVVVHDGSDIDSVFVYLVAYPYYSLEISPR